MHKRCKTRTNQRLVPHRTRTLSLFLHNSARTLEIGNVVPMVCVWAEVGQDGHEFVALRLFLAEVE